jgi:hypothetical protein
MPCLAFSGPAPGINVSQGKSLIAYAFKFMIRFVAAMAKPMEIPAWQNVTVFMSIPKGNVSNSRIVLWSYLSDSRIVG